MGVSPLPTPSRPFWDAVQINRSYDAKATASAPCRRPYPGGRFLGEEVLMFPVQ